MKLDTQYKSQTMYKTLTKCYDIKNTFCRILFLT